MDNRFKVYDKAWVMQNDKPTEMIVYAVIEEMSYWKQSEAVSYRLVSHILGASWGTSVPFDWDEVFRTRDDLIEFLKRTA